jgi:branched-chain amino acid aminotransferase
MGIPFVRRPIDRTELLVAEEIGICGTITELILAQSIEGLPLSAESPILTALQKRYFAAARGTDPHPAFDLSFLPTPTAVFEWPESVGSALSR